MISLLSRQESTVDPAVLNSNGTPHGVVRPATETIFDENWTAPSTATASTETQQQYASDSQTVSHFTAETNAEEGVTLHNANSAPESLLWDEMLTEESLAGPLGVSLAPVNMGGIVYQEEGSIANMNLNLDVDHSPMIGLTEPEVVTSEFGFGDLRMRENVEVEGNVEGIVDGRP